MVKSMTGFASLTHEDARATVAITIRSVNHRFLDVQLRVPQALADLEPRVRTCISRRLARGRIEVNISLQQRVTVAPEVDLNDDFANALSAALDRARERGLVAGALTPGDLLRLPQALTIRERALAPDPEVEAQLASSVEAAVEQALADLDAMRSREGEHLRVDLAQRTLLLGELLGQLIKLSEVGSGLLQVRLAERVREISATLPVDQALIAQEIVRAASRSDISEEVTRFRAHLAHWDSLTLGPEPCGRKLDFLLQEMNREINTIGSKADGLGIGEVIITTKAELEKMREQVQNVE
jgi:uncharacterized protein (TIGR00255 family)